MSAFSLSEADGVLTLRFDLPGEKVNLLTLATMDEFELRLEEVARRRDAKALLIESGKPGSFIAGADLRAFAELADVAAAEAASRRGQSVFARLEALPMATVALIHGACVGGGLELALACRHRVASDDPATKLGLPEVQLGILPGFGGTQRLPAVVGLVASLPLLLTGRRLAARAARRIGLVDALAPPERLREAALAVVAAPPRRGPRSWSGRAVEAALRTLPPLRRLLFSKARRQVVARAGDVYPAPLRILDAVAASCDSRRETGFAVESRLLGELLTGPVSRNLVRLFLLAERAPGEKEATRTIERAFVAGAGQMGAAIASLFAGAGIGTRLHDAAPAALARGVGKARELLRKRFRDDDAAARAAIDRLDPSIGRHGLKACDVALEAIVEVADAKRRLLAELEANLPDHALLLTNTSSLDLDELGKGLARSDRLVGLHFFHPAETMRLVEVVRGRGTSEEAVALACSLARRLGKVPVVVANRPGFLVNRLLTPYLLEGERLVGEGAPIAALDRALRAAGMPMGPIELLDEVGLDVALHVGGVMGAAFPERFGEVGLVRQLVAEGALGRKSGRGFYLHRARRRPEPRFARPAAAAAAAGSGGPSASASSTELQWVERLLLPVVAEAWRCLDERVVAGEDELDLAMMLGAGFLVPHGGPTRFARGRGLAAIVAGLERLEARHGARFAVPDALRAAAR